MKTKRELEKELQTLIYDHNYLHSHLDEGDREVAEALSGICARIEEIHEDLAEMEG